MSLYKRTHQHLKTMILFSGIFCLSLIILSHMWWGYLFIYFLLHTCGGDIYLLFYFTHVERYLFIFVAHVEG